MQTSNLNRLTRIFAHLFFLTLVFSSLTVHAQSCAGSGQFRICGLGGTHTFDFDAPQKVIDVTTRSRFNDQGQIPLPFSVQVDPLLGGSYALVSDTGESIDISLVFSQDGGSSTTLSPGIEVGFFNGSTQNANAQLTIDASNIDSASSTSYSATFQMTLRQYFFVFPTREVTVEFTIEFTVEPRITITGLGPIDLDNASVSVGQAIRGMEDFCVGGQGFAQYTVNLSSRSGSTGGGSGAAYQLAPVSGSIERIPYLVEFTDNLSSNSGSAPDTLGNITGAFNRNSNESCLADNARIIVTVAAGNWENASESSYVDVLTVTVTSQ